MDCSSSVSSVHGIFQTRTLEWVTISFSKGFSQPRDQNWVSCFPALAGVLFVCFFVFLTAVTTWDYKESWAPNNWCFWTLVLEKTLESPLDCKEIQPVHPKGDQSWVFIGRTDVEAETPILWPPDAKSWLIWKNPNAGKDWGQEEEGTTEDEMVGWHHQLDRCGFGWTPGVGDGQGGLACCDSWGHKELDTTERLNWTEPPGKPSTSGLNASVIGYEGIRRMHHPW